MIEYMQAEEDKEITQHWTDRCLKLEAENARLQVESEKHYKMYWSVLKHETLAKSAARKILRVYGNGQPKQLDDAVLLLQVAMAEYDKDEEPNAKVSGGGAFPPSA